MSTVDLNVDMNGLQVDTTISTLSHADTSQQSHIAPVPQFDITAPLLDKTATPPKVDTASWLQVHPVTSPLVNATTSEVEVRAQNENDPIIIKDVSI